MPIASLTGSTAGIEEAVVLLLIIAAAVAVVARRIGVPYTIGLTLVGLAVGVGAHVETLRLSSDLVFYVFLPILLFEAGFHLDAAHLRDQWRRILDSLCPACSSPSRSRPSACTTRAAWLGRWRSCSAR
jgi:Kef-type K+ transport system membrane component KefB